MNSLTRNRKTGWWLLLPALLLSCTLAGCEGDDGKDGSTGATGPTGTDGTDGTAGLNCWDLNQNGVPDLATEDLNRDGVVDVNDCRTPTGGYNPVTIHQGYFTENPYVGTVQCLNCHGQIGDDVLETAHWKWEGTVANIAGFEGTIHGKKDLINNFCQAVPSNEGRCAQCHIGYGWNDKSYDFSNPRNIDCLACHDQTGTYSKVPYPTPQQPIVGGPPPGLNLTNVAKSVGLNGGVPPRAACVFCHSRAGGDDNVKHGDINSRFGLTAPGSDTNPDPFDRTEDVHMGVDGGNFTCVRCHEADDRHGIAGFMYHSVDEGGDMQECTDCHAPSIHVGTSVENLLTFHERLACQVCHIPAIARKVATYTDWRWSMAGSPTPPPECAATPTGVAANGSQRGTYNTQKGCFTWGQNVRPTLRYYNGKWNRMIMGYNDSFTTTPVDLGSPTATYRDADAKIYPFKKMTGNQAADSNPANRIILVPHLYGYSTTDTPRGGVNPYWPIGLGIPAGYTGYNWIGALMDTAAYSPAYNGGDTSFSGTYDFVDTVMLLKVDHEVAPKEMAYGMGGACGDCHLNGQIDWAALGWTADPANGGTQTLP